MPVCARDNKYLIQFKIVFCSAVSVIEEISSEPFQMDEQLLLFKNEIVVAEEGHMNSYEPQNPEKWTCYICNNEFPNVLTLQTHLAQKCQGTIA